MGRSTSGVDCSFCSHKYYVTKYDIRNIGLPWQEVWSALCPDCTQLNIVYSKKRDFMEDILFEIKYDKEYLEEITIIKPGNIGRVRDIQNQIKNDKIKEFFVQQYVKENPKVFGFENLTGPFSTGPDLKGTWNGKEVEIEVERTYTNYKQHKHHLNRSFRKVSILICLDHKKPKQKSLEDLPSNIWYIDHQHFLEWYSNHIEKNAHLKSFQAVFGMLSNWFQLRLLEEVGYEISHFQFPTEENNQEINNISFDMTVHFIQPYLEQMKEPDFLYTELDVLKLLDFYCAQKDKYIESLENIKIELDY